MKKFFYNFYLIVTVLTFIGFITTFIQEKWKESFGYMFLTIAVATITIMLEPRKDKLLQERIEIMGLTILGLLMVALMFIIFIATGF